MATASSKRSQFWRSDWFVADLRAVSPNGRVGRRAPRHRFRQRQMLRPPPLPHSKNEGCPLTL